MAVDKTAYINQLKQQANGVKLGLERGLEKIRQLQEKGLLGHAINDWAAEINQFLDDCEMLQQEEAEIEQKLASLLDTLESNRIQHSGPAAATHFGLQTEYFDNTVYPLIKSAREQVARIFQEYNEAVLEEEVNEEEARRRSPPPSPRGRQGRPAPGAPPQQRVNAGFIVDPQAPQAVPAISNDQMVAYLRDHAGDWQLTFVNDSVQQAPDNRVTCRLTNPQDNNAVINVTIRNGQLRRILTESHTENTFDKMARVMFEAPPRGPKQIRLVGPAETRDALQQAAERIGLRVANPPEPVEQAVAVNPPQPPQPPGANPPPAAPPPPGAPAAGNPPAAPPAAGQGGEQQPPAAAPQQPPAPPGEAPGDPPAEGGEGQDHDGPDENEDPGFKP